MRNIPLLDNRLAAFNAHSGARVGDYLRLPRWNSRQPELTRFTHDWGDSLQTGGDAGGQYYLPSSAHLSYSGGLNPGVNVVDLIPSNELLVGSVWFFDENHSGAGRGVTFNAAMRVFRLAKDGKLDGLYELHTHQNLTVNSLQTMRDRNVSRFSISLPRTGYYGSHSLDTEAELHVWLAENQLKLTKPLADPRGWQLLDYLPNL